MHLIKIIVPLVAMYLALSANLEPANWALAVVLALGVAWLIRPAKAASSPARWPRQAWALVRYVLVLAVDVIRSGLNVASLVLRPSLPIDPGIVAMPSQFRSEAGRALDAHAITVTPGEMVVEMGADGVLYTHCLESTHSAAQAAANEARRYALLKELVE